MSKYLIIFESKVDNEHIVRCHGVYEFYEALGRAVVLMDDRDDVYESTGYSVYRDKDFSPLANDSNYEWDRSYISRDNQNARLITEHWYLAEIGQE